MKRIAIISNKHGIYEVTNQLPNDWQFRTLRNQEIPWTSQNPIGPPNPAPTPTPKMKTRPTLPDNRWKIETEPQRAIPHENQSPPQIPPMAAAPQAITPRRHQPHPPPTKWPKEGLTAHKKIMTKLSTRLSPIPIPIPTENVRKPLAPWRPQGGQEWNIRRKWVNDIYLYSFAHSFTKSSFTFLKWKKQAVILKDYLLLKNIFA